MKEHTREEPQILAAAERQMHVWAMNAELKDRTISDESGIHATRPALRYVAISREAGVGGSEIGQAVGQSLHWKVFDKNLLDCIAERFDLPRIMLDLVDETRTSWVYDVLGTWMDRKIVPHEKFVNCLTRVVLSAAQGGPAVFVGRGAQFVLPRREVFAVRLIASPKYRIEQIMRQTGMSSVAARHRMIEVDQGRREFVEQFFHHDVTDPHEFDLVINVERCGRNEAVQAILGAVEVRQRAFSA